MPPALISVIIPVRNCEQYLGEAIRSILAQAHRPVEIIVVDDGSTDGTAQVAQSFGPPVVCVAHDRHNTAAARNRGVELAQGEFLAFLDADDVWSDNKLSLQLSALEAHLELDAVFGLVENFISPDLDEAARKRLRCPPERMAGLTAGAMLIRRGAFERLGYFDPQWQIVEVVDWCVRAIEKGMSYQVLPELVMRRRLHATNKTTRQREEQIEYVRMAKAALERRRQTK
jgi:glycosyltransferase involved in cell wall biosynthesis